MKMQLIQFVLQQSLLTKMSSKLSYTKLQINATPRLTSKATNEQRFWKKYTNQQFLTSNSAVSSISTNANQKGYMVFAHGRTVSLVDTVSKETVKKIESYTFPVTAVAIRRDGMLMATGDEQGRIEVKDTKQKFSLRTFDNHKKRINCLDFHNHDLYSGGEDMTLRLFDVASGSVVHSYENAHSDYIKCVKGLQSNHLLSGAYDGLIKLFDFRVHEAPVMQFNHGGQVQWFDTFPSNMNFVACGDKKISSWDLRSPNPIFQNNTSKKLITCVRVISGGSRIMSSSYDNLLKIYKSDTFEVTYQQKMESPILCFDVSKNNQFIGMGLENKKIIFKTRANTQDEDIEEEDKQIQEEFGLWFKNNQTKGKFAYNDQYFYRGIYDKPQSFDIKFERNQNKKVGQYDRFLKKFQYKKALFTSLDKKNMTIFLALIQQFQQRGCLDRVIKSLTESQTQTLLEKLSQFVHDIRYSDVTISLIKKLINFQSDISTGAWNTLGQHLQDEVEVICKFAQITGMLDLIQKNCSN